MPRAEASLVHSVAFRVSEDQWNALKQYAEAGKTTIPQLAKKALFEKVGLEIRSGGRRRHGQTRQNAARAKSD